MKAFLISLKPFLKFIVIGLLIIFLIAAIVALFIWLRKQRTKPAADKDDDIKRVN